MGENANVGSLTTRSVFKQDSGAASSNSSSLRQGTKVNLAPPMQVMGGDDVVEEEAYIQECDAALDDMDDSDQGIENQHASKAATKLSSE